MSQWKEFMNAEYPIIIDLGKEKKEKLERI